MAYGQTLAAAAREHSGEDAVARKRNLKRLARALERATADQARLQKMVDMRRVRDFCFRRICIRLDRNARLALVAS